MSPRNTQRRRRRRTRRERRDVQEQVLKTERIQIERKSFEITLKENPRGRFLCIAEEVGSHRDMIIIPGVGLNEFSGALSRMLEYMNQLPPLQLSTPPTGVENQGGTSQNQPS